MEECSVLIETTKSAEDKTSRWFDLPIDYELFRDLLGVEADSGDYQITDMKLPFAGDIVRTTSVRRLNKLYLQCQFDCKLKKVVKGIVRNYRKELARRQAKEVSFCELPEIVVEKLIVWDDYESEYTTFDVCGTEIRVLDEELAEALKQLPEQSRNIVLMFFFLDMSDSEIGEKLNINRSTSYRHRRNSLEEIRKQLKEKKTNEE